MTYQFYLKEASKLQCNITENFKKFEDLLKQVNREGMDQLISFLRRSDFYHAPASSRYHNSKEGGLCEHSLNVFEILKSKSLIEGNRFNVGWHKDYETIILVALLHDICKTNYYTTEMRNVKKDGAWVQVPYYTVNDTIPYGHGEKSVMMIEQFIKLEPFERYAIRWHMGFTEPKELWGTLGQAMRKCPLVLALHEADLEATYLMEKENGE